jgi:hypothetical protein
MAASWHSSQYEAGAAMSRPPTVTALSSCRSTWSNRARTDDLAKVGAVTEPRVLPQGGAEPLTIALAAGLHGTFIAHVERQARNISLDNIERIAVALGVRVHELLMP